MREITVPKDLDQQIKDSLSALLDNECPDSIKDSITCKVTEDVSVRDQLARYQMISDCLRGESVNRQSLDISIAVSRRLQEEPTILAPTPISNKKEKRWIQPVVGTALAASIAALGITFGPQLIQQSSPNVSPGFKVVAEPISVRPDLVSHKQTHWKTLKPEMGSQLDGYLEEHSEHAVQGGVQGVMPYTSFVSYDGIK